MCAALLPGLAPGEAPARVVSGDIGTRHAAARVKFAKKLAELAEWADGQNLPAEAKISRSWLPAAEPNRIALACRPAPGDTAELPESSSDEWRARFQKLRTAQAAELFALAEEAAEHGHAAAAFPLLVEVIRDEPGHERARKILGYELHEGRWLTPFEIAKANDGQAWDSRFGWLPAKYVTRYEAGERYYNNRWITAEEDQRSRADPRKGWDVVTEHYNIHTTHSLEEGVRLATRLERLYDAWQQMFTGFYATDAQLARRFKLQAATHTMPQRHRVMYFRDREEYIKALEKEEPGIRVSTGYYLANKKTAYFYAGDEDGETNLYHEATHQLFTELGKTVRDMGRDGNFWAVEGIACFMESLTEGGGWHLLGGSDAVRLQDARHRLLVDNYYVPLAELTALGMEQLKRDPNIAMLYSQSAGMTYFLMFADHGRYRAPQVAYLAAIYRGAARPGTLAEVCRSTNEELDDQYRTYLESVDE
jgi:hypothetical protein